MTAGTQEQIQAVLEANIFPTLIEMLQNQDVSFDVKKELVWAVANAANGTQGYVFLILMLCQVEHLLKSCT